VQLHRSSLEIAGDFPGLFTDRGRSSGKAVTHEVVVDYHEWVTTKPMLWDRFAWRVKDADNIILKVFWR